MSKPQDKQDAQKSNIGRQFFGRKKPEADEINEFMVGDLASLKPVTIGKNGAIAGNISAPSVKVKGTIFGSVTAPEVAIEQTGQVWGDVFASTLMITVNAKVHGWVSTFDVGTLELIQDGSLSASDVMSLNLAAQSEELTALKGSIGRESEVKNQGNQPEAYRRFQVEQGSALIARLELEQILLKSSVLDELEETSMRGVEGGSENSVQGRHEAASLNADEIQRKLNESIQQVEEANSKIARLMADKEKNDEELERLREERDLYKNRFEKLALWVYKYQRSSLKAANE